MSLLKANSVQIGQSATATNNFTLSVPASPDGTIKLARGNSGATTQDILTVNSAGAVTLSNGGTITLGTVQNSTSGTAIDFTGIPSWAKRITVMFQGVSTSGTSFVLIRLGTSSGFISSGYLGSAATANQTTGLPVDDRGAGTATRHGVITILNITSNSWVSCGAMGFSDATGSNASGGSISLASALTQIRITTVNGTDTFDAGTINIMYEG